MHCYVPRLFAWLLQSTASPVDWLVFADCGGLVTFAVSLAGCDEFGGRPRSTLTNGPNSKDDRMTNRKLFVNLPVKDLKKSMAFFSTLGFEFNPQFTNDKGASMVLNSEAYVMLLTEEFFQTFTDRKICDTRKENEALICVSAESRSEVDELVKKALANGATYDKEPQDHGFMYGWSFYDLDGHGWEVVWMDPAAIQK
jgi:hypothetical protein